MARALAALAAALAGALARVAALGVALACMACASDSIFGIDVSSAFKPGTALHVLDVGTLERSYVLHVPSRRPTTSSGMLLSYPLLIVLHGSGATGADIRVTTNMDSVGEANHWVVAYPNGMAGSGGLFPSDWNAGTCCGAAGRENIDDLGFIKNLITQLTLKLTIDKRRIYLAGFSDGGRMAYHVACQLAPQVAAVAIVSGSLRDDACAPSRAVSVIAIHGTADDVVPIDEASDTDPPKSDVTFPGAVSPSVRFWAGTDGCAKAVTSNVTSEVERTDFSGCRSSEVSFYALRGGTHAWPVLTSASATNPDESFAATPLIARFLARQSIH